MAWDIRPAEEVRKTVYGEFVTEIPVKGKRNRVKKAATEEDLIERCDGGVTDERKSEGRKNV